MRTIYAKLILLVILAVNATGQTTEDEIHFIYADSSSLNEKYLTWMSPTSYRPSIALNGDWEYRLNEDDPWKSVKIPSITEFMGKISYRKVFAVDSSFQNNKLKLVCYGINYYCTIFINKKFIGSHAGNNSFAVEVPHEAIKIGLSNIIEINVNTSLDIRQSLPLKNQILGRKNCGGIYRDIYLLALPVMSTKIGHYKYHIDAEANRADLELNFEIRSQIPKHPTNKAFLKKKLQCYVELWKPGARRPEYKKNIELPETIKPINMFDVKISIESPVLWEPEFPFLYELIVYLSAGRDKIDSTGMCLGLKDLRIENENLLLNGKRFILKGINYQENVCNYENSPKLADMEHLIEQVKYLNANAVRVVGSPLHPYWTELCDRKGVLLFQEIPLNWIPSSRLKDEQFRTLVADYLLEVVLRDKNHVSVCAWGVGGPFCENLTILINSFYDKIREFDNTPLYQLNSIYVQNAKTRAEIIALDLFDIDKHIIARRINDWLKDGEKKLMVVTFGSSIQEAIYKDENPAILEEIQVANITEAWKILTQFQQIDGFFVNSLTDWKINYPLNSFGPRENQDIYPSGLMKSNRKKRLALNAVRSLFLEGKTRINPGLRLQVEHPSIFPLVGVVTLLIFLFIYNTRRYVQENLRRIFIHPHGFFVDIRDKRKVPVSHTLLIALINSLGLALVTATLLFYYRENIFFDHLLTVLSVMPSIKTELIALIWDPALAILFFTAFFLFAFIIIGLFIKIFSIIFRKKLPLNQSLTISFWSATNYMLMIPIGMILYRVLILKSMFYFMMGLILFFFLWHIARLIKAIKVVYFWSSFRSVIFILFCIAIVSLSIIYYFQQKFAILDYLSLYANHLIKY